MDHILVIGHQSQDTDSIVSAIAHAALRNVVDDREFEAAQLGYISDETPRILKRFGWEARFGSIPCAPRSGTWTMIRLLRSMQALRSCGVERTVGLQKCSHGPGYQRSHPSLRDDIL